MALYLSVAYFLQTQETYINKLEACTCTYQRLEMCFLPPNFNSKSYRLKEIHFFEFQQFHDLMYGIETEGLMLVSNPLLANDICTC